MNLNSFSLEDLQEEIKIIDNDTKFLDDLKSQIILLIYKCENSSNLNGETLYLRFPQQTVNYIIIDTKFGDYPDYHFDSNYKILIYDQGKLEYHEILFSQENNYNAFGVSHHDIQFDFYLKIDPIYNLKIHAIPEVIYKVIKD
jgi:hypothetical protein